MNLKFGIKELVDSFMRIEDSDFRLILCGDGDARDYVEEKSKIDNRIEYKGMVSAEKAREFVGTADVLVNPRPNDEEYTKYSFPSKNIEYLMTGKPVVAHLLDGMPSFYENFLYVIPDNVQNFEEVLLKAYKNDSPKLNFFTYAENKLAASSLIDWILNNQNVREE